MQPPSMPTLSGRPERKTLPLQAVGASSNVEGGLGKTPPSSMPFGFWGPPSGVKQHRPAEDEVRSSTVCRSEQALT